MADTPRALFVTDLDGTLLGPERTLPMRNAAAIRSATAHGTVVALVTGRRLSSLRSLGSELGNLELRLAVSNGAVILTPDASRPEKVYELDWQLIDQLAHRPELEHAILNCITAPSSASGTPRDGPPDCLLREAGTRRWFTSWTPYQRETWRDADLDLARRAALVHVALRVATRREAERVAGLIEPTLPAAVSVHVVRSPVGDGALCELVPRGGKGLAVRYLSETLGVAPARTAAIGDELNDCDLLDAAAERYAIGGSVLAAARPDATRVASAADGGVAEALERFLSRASGSGS